MSKRRHAPKRTYYRIPLYKGQKEAKLIYGAEVSMAELVAVSGRRRRGDSRGLGKVLFFDLDIDYMDSSAFEHFVGLPAYDKWIFL